MSPEKLYGTDELLDAGQNTQWAAGAAEAAPEHQVDPATS